MLIKHKDIWTPANILSLFGLSLVCIGSFYLYSLSGVLLMGTGRVLDLMDGLIARRTHTSELGAAIDAIFDKLAVVLIVAASAWYGLVYWPLLAWIIVQNSANAALAFAAKASGIAIKPTIAGKRTMFLQNTSVGLLLLSNVVPQLHTLLVSAGILTGIASVPLGMKATYIYLLHVMTQRRVQ